MKTINLSEKSTVLWLAGTPLAAAYRRTVRVQALDLSRAHGRATVEIYSHDGIVLDALHAGADGGVATC